MAVCRYFNSSRGCKNGENCTFQHPGQKTAWNPSGNRFGALSGAGFGGQASRQTQPQANYNVRPEDIKEDLLPRGRPQWIFSSYGPLRDLPRQLFGGPQREISMEEMRLRHYQAVAAGNMNQAVQEADSLYQEAMNQIDVALNDLTGAAKYIADGANEHPNRIDIVAGNVSGNTSQASSSGQSAFGQASTTSQPSNAFGGAPSASSFGQPSSLGQGSAFGQPSTVGQSSAFGKPSSLGQGSAFGQPSAVGQSSFGQPSSLGQGSAFGQPSAVGQSSAFGKPSSLGQGSAFGQPSNLGGQGAFGQPAFGQSGFAKPATTSAFGQPAFGQPSAPAAPFGGAAASSSPFATVNQQNKPSPFGAQPAAPANPSPFGQAAQNSSPFGQPSAPSSFGQPSQNPSPFGQPQQPQPQNSSTFGQPSAPAAANPFGAAQQPAAAAAAPAASPFGQPAGQPAAQPAAAQVPVVNNDVGPPVFMQIDDPNELNPLPRLDGETRRDASNRLLSWKGRPVKYVDNEACYLHPQDNKTLVRINFPYGPPAPGTFRQSQGTPEEYTPEIIQAYEFFLANGKFKDGIVPAVPPKREWIGHGF